jgi:hypothetical protein
MYLTGAGRLFEAGHESAGVTAPSTTWYFAEGATGPFFDTFVLIANPTDEPAEVRVTFARADARVVAPGDSSIVERTYTVAPRSRFNIWVDAEDPALADTALAAIVESTNGVPVVAERAMWWPGPTAATWAEAHDAFGATATSSLWGFADGEDGGANGAETYVLVSEFPIGGAGFTVRLLFEDGTTAIRSYRTGRRTNIAVGLDFPEARDRRFAAVVERPYTKYPTNSPEVHWWAPTIVERSIYSSADGAFWAAGSSAPATNLLPYLVSLPAAQATRDIVIPVGHAVTFVSTSNLGAWTVSPDDSADVPGCAELANIGALTAGQMRTSVAFTEPKTCAWKAEYPPWYPPLPMGGRIVVR